MKLKGRIMTMMTLLIAVAMTVTVVLTTRELNQVGSAIITNLGETIFTQYDEEMTASMEETSAASQEMAATSQEIEKAVASIAKRSEEGAMAANAINKRAETTKVNVNQAEKKQKNF